jgi:hypothetical protein
VVVVWPTAATDGSVWISSRQPVEGNTKPEKSALRRGREQSVEGVVGFIPTVDGATFEGFSFHTK